MADLLAVWWRICWRLNPFMNQVYFYFGEHCINEDDGEYRLNPFMNQVYFYTVLTGETITILSRS